MGFQKISLKGRALRLLAGREHSRAELEKKLAAHAPESGELKQALDDLQAKGFINEQRVVDSLLHRRAARLGRQNLAPDRLQQQARSVQIDAIALLEFGCLALVVPPVGHDQREGVEIATQEVLPGDVLIPEHLDLYPVRVEAVLEVALPVTPPILDPVEGDRLALLQLANLVGACDRQHLPVVLLDPVGRELDGMARLRAERQGFQQILPALLGAAGDGEGVIVEPGHLAYLGAVVVVVPGVAYLLAAHHLEGKEPVIGGDGLAVRPARLGVEAKIEGLVIGAEGPLVGQHGNGIAGHRMGGEQGQIGFTNVTGEAAVGVGPVLAQGEREARHEVTEGAAPFGLRVGIDGVCVIALPFEIRRQGGTPAEGAPAEGEHHGRDPHDTGQRGDDRG